MADDVIRIAAAIVIRPDGKTLLVRKRGTAAFMQPGGKIEPGETPAAALRRELNEELGIVFDPAEAGYLGRFEAPAANEPGRTVSAELFRLTIGTRVLPAAEIEEVVWVEPGAPAALVLAPLTRDYLLPLAAPCRNEASTMPA